MQSRSKRRRSLCYFAFISFALVALLVTASLADLRGAEVAGQANPYAPQCPDLWDAVGRTFPVAIAPGGPYAIVGMEIAEFSGDGPTPQALTCISDKLTVLHARWGSTQHISTDISLPHFAALAYGQAAQIKYGFWMSVDSNGITNISLLFGRDNHLVTLLFQADVAWTNQYFDSTAYSIWNALDSIPARVLTFSDQPLSTGLWQLLTLPAMMTYDRSNDYLPVMFTGVDDNGRSTTPALISGRSRVGADLNGPLDADGPTDSTAILTSTASVLYLTPTAELLYPTCAPNASTVGCDLTPAGALRAHWTQTAAAGGG